MPIPPSERKLPGAKPVGGRKYSTAFQQPATTARKPPIARTPSAESFYFQKQMQNHVVLVVTLEDGERLTGTLEWFDDACIKVRCGDGTRTVIYKHSIRYITKHGEE